MAIARASMGGVDLSLTTPVLEPWAPVGWEQDFRPSYAADFAIVTDSPAPSDPFAAANDLISQRLFGGSGGSSAGLPPSSPSPLPASHVAPSQGGAVFVPASSGGALYGATAPRQTADHPVPWTMVAAGVGALALIGVAAFALKKKRRR